MPDYTAIVPSYNHAAFIVEAIHSVANQTFPPREIIVVDDASRDQTLARLAEIALPNLRVISLDRNGGGAESLNVGIRAATSPFIAICNSDDAWEPTKVERQFDQIARNEMLAAVFTHVAAIDVTGGPAAEENVAVFLQPNRSRHEWLRHLVNFSNCLCHPSVLVRRAAYDALGPYDNRFRQLPDFEMWLRLVQRHDIHVIPERLVRMRFHADNTSAVSLSAAMRDRNEFTDIMLGLFRGMATETFAAAFGTRREPADAAFDIRVEKILYLWSANAFTRIGRWVAGELGMDLLATAEGRRAWAAYGLEVFDFHVLRGLDSPWYPARPAETLSPAELDFVGRHGLRPIVAPPVVAPPVLVQPAPEPGPRPTIDERILREIRRVGRQISGLSRS